MSLLEMRDYDAYPASHPNRMIDLAAGACAVRLTTTDLEWGVALACFVDHAYFRAHFCSSTPIVDVTQSS